jgi:hypothetical protein
MCKKQAKGKRLKVEKPKTKNQKLKNKMVFSLCPYLFFGGV